MMPTDSVFDSVFDDYFDDGSWCFPDDDDCLQGVDDDVCC